MALGGGWYYNDKSDKIIYDPPVLGLVQLRDGLLGWHGPFNTKAEAIADAAKHGINLTSNNVTAVKNLGAAGVKAGASAVSAATGIGSLFQKQIWIRVAEVAIGIALLLVGLVKLTNVVPKLESLATKVVP